MEPPCSSTRWSAPTLFPRPWDFTGSIDTNPHIRSKHDSITTVGHGVPELVSQRPFSVSESLFKKSEVRWSAVELPEESSSTSHNQKPRASQLDGWKPSFLQISPLLGIASLIIAFCQIFASYAVLNVSNGRAVEGWQYRPAVYLAILAVVSNKAISFAAIQGAVVTFWLRALRGTTLGQLHRDWEYGSDVCYALRAGRHFNLLAVACIFATLVGIDGALLQRASSVESQVSDHPIELSVSITPEVPSYFSGWYQYNSFHGGVNTDFSDAMLPIAKEYSSASPIVGGVSGCEGQCAATVRAPALVAHHCESNPTWKNYSAPYSPRQQKEYDDYTIVPLHRDVFGTWLASINGSSETLDLRTYISGDDVALGCAGLVYDTHCYLRSAIAEYEVLVKDDTITLVNPAYPKFVAWANNTAITPETISKFGLRAKNKRDLVRTTLGGLVNAFFMEFAYVEAAEPPKTPGRLDIGYVNKSWFVFQHTTNYKQYVDGEACSYAWKDPRPAIMAGLNELMFRIGVHTAGLDTAHIESRLDPNLETRYTTTGSYRSPHNVFKSDFRYFYGAVALELLTIGVVASTFAGFWRLGRNVSFSPLEIAKAFDAPLLAGLARNLHKDETACLMEVQYGVVDGQFETDEAGMVTDKLTISRQEEVRTPESQILTAREHYQVLKLWACEVLGSIKSRITEQ